MLSALCPHQGKINIDTIEDKALGASESDSLCFVLLVLDPHHRKINTYTVEEKALGASRISVQVRLDYVYLFYSFVAYGLALAT